MGVVETTALVGLFVLGFLVGKVWERWWSGNLDIQDEAYQAGYQAGLRSNKWPSD